MEDKEKTKEQLLKEIGKLRTKIDYLKQSGNEQKLADDLLTMEKDFSDTLLNNANTFIIILDTNANITLFNQFAEKLTGYKKDEVLGRNWFDLFIPKRDDHVISSIFKDLLEEMPEVSSYENLVLCKNGSEKLINWENTILKDERKEISGILSIGIDITKRKQAEEALKESEELYRKLISTIPDVIIRTDVNGNIVFCNEVFLKLFPSFTFEDLLGKNMLSFFPKEDRLRVQRNTKLMFEQSLGVKEYQIQLANVKYDFEVNGEVLRDASLQPTGMVYILRDVTKRKQAETALKESEEKYRLLATNTLDTIWTLNLESKMTFVNDAVYSFLGYTPEEFLGLNPATFTTSEGIKIIQNVVEQLIAKFKKGEIIQSKFELQQIRKDGRIIDVEIRSNVLLNSKGELIGFQGRSIDITERKQAEKAMQKSEEQYRLLTETAKDFIILHDMNGQILFANAATLEQTGYSYEEFIKMSVQDFVTKDNMKQLFRNQELRKNNDFSRNTFEIKVNTKEGEEIPLEIVSSPYIFDGKINAILLIARNITERKQAEQELIKLSTAVQQSPSEIAITDLKGNLEYVNQKFTKITGYSFEEAKGINPRILKSGKLSDEVYIELWETISSGNEWRGEFQNKKKNGELYWEAASVSPIFNKQGNITNFLKVAEDITNRKKMEEELRKRIEDLEIFNDAAVDREIMINELRREINEILVKLGKEEKYEIIT